TAGGVEIVPAASVDDLAEQAGLSGDEADALQDVYAQSQVESLRVAFTALTVFALLALLFSRGIPDEVLGRKPDETQETPGSAEPAAGSAESAR
ncbi:MAG TPA: hypothetical protein VKA62_05785, partial [Agromyces sp.]|nr:hypothetical protein [Agromyces sp.]